MATGARDPAHLALHRGTAREEDSEVIRKTLLNDANGYGTTGQVRKAKSGETVSAHNTPT